MVFTRRERVILRQIANGHNAAEIAEDLEISPSTVGRHVRSATRKAGLQNRYQLIVYLFQNPRCLLKHGRCAPGLHNTETCECDACRYMRLPDLPLPEIVPSAREVVEQLRGPRDWKDLAPAPAA